MKVTSKGRDVYPSDVGIDFLKVVRLVFWSGVVGPGTNHISNQLSLARASRSLARAPRSYDRASRSQSRYALKSSTCEQV